MHIFCWNPHISDFFRIKKKIGRMISLLLPGTISKTDKDYMELIQLDPTPPSTVDTWNRVVTRLLASRAMLALAYLTVGFPPDCHKINRFDGGCIADVDCSDGYVEDVSYMFFIC